MSRAVMIFGIGEVGSWALEFLARRQEVDALVTADIREDWGVYRTEMAAVGAALEGQRKRIEFRRVDARDVDATAKLLAQVKPAVIVNAMTIRAPRTVRDMLSKLPEETRQKASAALKQGIQLPWHCLLAGRLTQALKKSGITAHVVNISSCDTVNPILWRRDLGPTCGAGNGEHIAYEIKRMVSAREGVPSADVQLYFVGGGTALVVAGPQKFPPLLKVFVRGKDVTASYDIPKLVEDARRTRFFPIGSPPQLFSNIGASACKNAMAILNNSNELMTVNSPNGYPGDYPVRLSSEGAELALPRGLPLEKAMKIGYAGLLYHGIQEIRADGTVVYTDESYQLAKEVLGYDCKELHFEEMESRAEELTTAFERLLRKY